MMKKKTILMSPADSKIYEFFERQFNVISSECLYDFISFERHHADMQALNLFNKLFINSNCTRLYKLLTDSAIEFTTCENIGYEYPYNVALNAAVVGNILICNEKALHQNIKEFCLNNEIKIINVNQGYAKCSTLVIDENSIITDDESIRRAAQKNNLNVLKIEKGDIYLDNNNVGFIGGASAKIGETVYFFGDINTHKNAEEIKKFIRNAGLEIKCTSNSNLVDIGGIVTLY